MNKSSYVLSEGKIRFFRSGSEMRIHELVIKNVLPGGINT